MSSKAQHVVPNGVGWGVLKAGSSRVTRKFETQEEAIKEGRKFAKNQETELFIHGRDGRIYERDSYRNNTVHNKG